MNILKKLSKFVFIFCSFFIFIQCSDKKKNDFIVDSESIKIDYKSYHFADEFYRKRKSITQLRKEFPLFFQADVEDPVYENRQNDKFEKELYEESKKVFKDIKIIDNQIITLFKTIKYYYPTFKEPIVYYLINRLEYTDFPVIYDKEKSVLIIGLDNFLGKKQGLYQIAKLYDYQTQKMNPENILPEIVNALCDEFIAPKLDKTLLGEMTYEGKKMLLKDAFLPEVEDSIKMAYTKKQMDWVIVNESDTYNYFLQEDLLFTEKPDSYKRFIEDAPYSKFYTEVDQQSPGRVGVWMGWQILRAYYQQTKDLKNIMRQTDSQMILKMSKYKPEKK